MPDPKTVLGGARPIAELYPQLQNDSQCKVRAWSFMVSKLLGLRAEGTSEACDPSAPVT